MNEVKPGEEWTGNSRELVSISMTALALMELGRDQNRCIT
jgi:hypothetical protein